MKRAFCYLPENQLHHLDHLIPLAIELDLPIATHCENGRDLIASFYPQANCFWIPANQPLQLPEASTIISTLPKYQLQLDLFLESKLYGPFESVYCPHGLSDKEMLSSQFRELHLDRKVLLYGEKMGKEIPSNCLPFYVGNYRKHHFESFKNLYLSKLQEVTCRFQERAWKLLWAPTWIDRSSQNNALERILEKSLLSQIPEEIQLIFKPHPNLIKQIPSTLNKIKETSEKRPNLLYLEKTPYIYPLFERVDAYLGDTSSVGYDFLTTSKPIFSLSKNLQSPWQKIALEAPLKEGALDWNGFLKMKTQWNAARTFQLLEQSFVKIGPLCARKGAFYEYLNRDVQ